MSYKSIKYIATNNPHRVIEVVESEDKLKLASSFYTDPLDWSLVNTLNNKTMAKARALAKAHGYKLKDVSKMAIKYFREEN